MPVVIRTCSIEGHPLPGLGIKRAIVLCILFYIVFVAVMVAQMFGLAMVLPPGELAIDVFSLTALPQLLAWLVTIATGLKWADMSFREARFEASFPWRTIPALVAISVGAAIVLSEISLWIPMSESFRRSLIEEIERAPFLTALVPLVVMAPLAEEFFFRGLLLRDFFERYSVTKSIWATAIMFSLFHLNPWQAVVALPLGLWFAWLVLRTSSILPAIFCHAVYNFSTTFALKPLAQALGYTADEWRAVDHLPPALLALGAVLTVAGGALLWRQLSGANAVEIDTSGPITSRADDLVAPAESAQEIVGLGESESGIQDLSSNEGHRQGLGSD